MTPTGFHVVADLRMIEHSGVGVYLNTLLEGVQDLMNEDADLENRLHFSFLGRQALFTRTLPPAIHESSQRIAFNAPIYGVREQLQAAGRIRAATHTGAEGSRRFRTVERPVVFWPHYNFPLRWKGPMVVTVHDLVHSQHPPQEGTGFYQSAMLRMLRRRLRRADRGGPSVHVLTDSRHVKVLLQRMWRFPPHRVWNVGAALPSVFRPPRSENEFQSSVEELPRSLGLPKRYWLTVGLFKPHKNLPWLLNQLGQYWKAGWFGGVELVMAGTLQSPDLLQRLDADERLRDRVKVLPSVPDEQLRALYWGAEALLFPSLTEGFGLPMLEAMACGTPLVCSRRAPMSELADGVAWFFDPERSDDSDSPDRLAAALRVVAGVSVASETTAVSADESDRDSSREADALEDADIDSRLHRGIARARQFTRAAFARRVLEIWEMAAEDKPLRR